MITLSLTIDEVNGILAYLGKGPYEQVVGLVAKIKDQAVPQLKAAEPKKQEEVKAE